MHIFFTMEKYMALFYVYFNINCIIVYIYLNASKKVCKSCLNNVGL